MAYQIGKINSLDIDPNIGVGVSLNYQSPGVFNTTYTTTQATKNNLINYLLTEQGERYMNPTFGLGLQKYVFQQLNDTTVAAIEEDIQTQIQELFPTVVINTLEIKQNPDTNQIGIELTFTVGRETDTIDIIIG